LPTAKIIKSVPGQSVVLKFRTKRTFVKRKRAFI